MRNMHESCEEGLSRCLMAGQSICLQTVYFELYWNRIRYACESDRVPSNDVPSSQHELSSVHRPFAKMIHVQVHTGPSLFKMPTKPALRNYVQE